VIRATQIYHIRLQYSRLQAPITTEQSTRHRLQPSRVQGTDYNRAEYKAPITDYKSAPATASSAKPNRRQRSLNISVLCTFCVKMQIPFYKYQAALPHSIALIFSTNILLSIYIIYL